MIGWLKALHVSMAALSIAGFLVRGFWAWRAPAALKPWFNGPMRAGAFVGAVIVFAWIVSIARAHRFVPFAG